MKRCMNRESTRSNTYVITCDGDHGSCPSALKVTEPYPDASRTEEVLRDRGWEWDDVVHYCPHHSDHPEDESMDDLKFEWDRDVVDQRLDDPLEVGDTFKIQTGNSSAFHFETIGVDEDTYRVEITGFDPPRLTPTFFNRK